jgi:DNA-binding MarR family transcriptional regulator
VQSNVSEDVSTKRFGPVEYAAWAGFLDTHSVLWKELEARLAQTGLSMTDYDVLLKLQQAAPEGLRMSELSSRLLMSSGGTTRLADRLERRRLVKRSRFEDDRRGFVITITPLGRTALSSASSVHLGDVRELFLSHLSEAELKVLASVWERLQEVVAQARQD